MHTSPRNITPKDAPDPTPASTLNPIFNSITSHSSAYTSSSTPAPGPASHLSPISASNDTHNDARAPVSTPASDNHPDRTSGQISAPNSGSTSGNTYRDGDGGGNSYTPNPVPDPGSDHSGPRLHSGTDAHANSGFDLNASAADAPEKNTDAHASSGSKSDSPSLTTEELAEARRVASLISGFITRTLSETQARELDDWVSLSKENLVQFKKLTNEKNIDRALNRLRELNVEAAMDKVQLQIQQYRLRRRLIRAGFIILIFLVLALVFLLFR